MNRQEISELTVNVEGKISAMLKELELRTGCNVSEVLINDTEITTIGDSTPQRIRRAIVVLTRLPGTQWQT